MSLQFTWLFQMKYFHWFKDAKLGHRDILETLNVFYLYFSLNLSNIYSSLLFFSKTYLHLLNICLFHLDPK